MKTMCSPAILEMLGAIGPEVGLFKQAAKEIKDILQREDVADISLGLDICEPPLLFALQEQGIRHDPI
jgi:hypothetical protein